MSQIEVAIPDHLEAQLQRLVEEGEFVSREEAIDELITLGISTYSDAPGDDDEGDLAFADEMQNPGERSVEEDDYAY